MKLPRDLHGIILAKVLCQRWGYAQVHQTGSHIVLETVQPKPHRIAIPRHKALKVGTLHAILRAVALHKNVARTEILATVLHGCGAD